MIDVPFAHKKTTRKVVALMSLMFRAAIPGHHNVAMTGVSLSACSGDCQGFICHRLSLDEIGRHHDAGEGQAAFCDKASLRSETRHPVTLGQTLTGAGRFPVFTLRQTADALQPSKPMTTGSRTKADPGSWSKWVNSAGIAVEVVRPWSAAEVLGLSLFCMWVAH